MRLEDLMERAAKYDENLARDIKDYVRGRNYGLIYEASKPEFVRMWKKPVVRGDIVNVLPPRGVMEDTKSEDDPSEIVYKVIGISDGVASLRDEQTDEIVTASIDDIVALARFDKPIYAGLKEIDRVERGGDKPYHVVINGENYHALQTLVYAYQGQVDCIYIDPPYNTGATDWKYNNNYVGKDDKYRHSKWLTFMEDRLRLARKLLNPKDSVLIVTIDEKEYLRLGLLLEQLFPEAKIQMVSSVIRPSGMARGSEFSRANEYLYILRFGDCIVSPLPLSEEWKGNIQNTTTNKVRWQSLMRGGSNSERSHSPGCFYPIFISLDKKHILGVGKPVPIDIDYHTVKLPKDCISLFPVRPDGDERVWQYSPDKFLEIQRKGYVRISTRTKNECGVTLRYISDGWQKKVEKNQINVIGKNEDGSLVFDDEFDNEFIPPNQWWISSHNATDQGSKLLQNIIGARFPYPKSLYAVHDVLRFFVNNKPESLIVDFFAGSGTTLNAVNLFNAEDGGCRRCIMVTNNEVSENEEKIMTAKGLRQTDEEWQNIGIARHVTWPRTVCTIEGHDINGKPLKDDYITELIDETDAKRSITQIGYFKAFTSYAFSIRKEIICSLSGKTISKSSIEKGDVFAISNDDISILWDTNFVDEWLSELEEYENVHRYLIITDDSKSFKTVKAKVLERFGTTYKKKAKRKIPMADGLKENAVFFDLEYLEPSIVSADLAFDRIAPILWLAGGCKGKILQHQKGYVIGETYAVLFDPRYKTRFVDAVLENKEIKTVFIVTDAAERYRSLCAELPGCRVMQLYESYLRSFEINAIG